MSYRLLVTELKMSNYGDAIPELNPKDRNQEVVLGCKKKKDELREIYNGF